MQRLCVDRPSSGQSCCTLPCFLRGSNFGCTAVDAAHCCCVAPVLELTAPMSAITNRLSMKRICRRFCRDLLESSYPSSCHPLLSWVLCLVIVTSIFPRASTTRRGIGTLSTFASSFPKTFLWLAYHRIIPLLAVASSKPLHRDSVLLTRISRISFTLVPARPIFAYYPGYTLKNHPSRDFV